METRWDALLLQLCDIGSYVAITWCGGGGTGQAVHPEARTAIDGSFIFPQWVLKHNRNFCNFVSLVLHTTVVPAPQPNTVLSVSSYSRRSLGGNGGRASSMGGNGGGRPSLAGSYSNGTNGNGTNGNGTDANTSNRIVKQDSRPIEDNMP